MNILALDPATKCGWALDFDGMSGTWDLSVKRDESSGLKLYKLRNLMDALDEEYELDLVVFEAARNAGPRMQGALVHQAEIQGTIKLWCEEINVDYKGYSPSEIKKHATGKGNANKLLMMAAAEHQWPHLSIADDNEADALWLLDLAKKEFS